MTRVKGESEKEKGHSEHCDWLNVKHQKAGKMLLMFDKSSHYSPEKTGTHLLPGGLNVPNVTTFKGCNAPEDVEA